ncbi:MAG: hypothetical protein ACJAUP_002551 [Cellvibrionaceae bacterium]
MTTGVPRGKVKDSISVMVHMRELNLYPWDMLAMLPKRSIFVVARRLDHNPCVMVAIAKNSA